VYARVKLEAIQTLAHVHEEIQSKAVAIPSFFMNI